MSQDKSDALMQQLLTAYGSQFNDPSPKPAYVHQEYPKAMFHPDYLSNNKLTVLAANEKEEKKYLAKKYTTIAPHVPVEADDSETE